ncbi:MAG: galactokinase [Proteobacteria bacterium]|nr:galactokinase [Pseudomonadota bacterium]
MTRSTNDQPQRGDKGSNKARSRTVRERISAAFETITGQRPAMWIRAPGRVNLIGEHTDYNDGFVLPMAIDRSVWIALSFDRPDDKTVTLHSIDFDETDEFSVDRMDRSDRLERIEQNQTSWIDYARGVAWALGEAGHEIGGFRGVVGGDVPIGAGLSSSAAIELAVARALVAAVDGPWDPTVMARLAQRAEREWVGMNCGIMDQLVCAAGQRDRALLIDCRSLAAEPVPIPSELAVVVLDTARRRELVNSAFGERRAQCERAASTMGVATLRDVDLADVEAHAADLDPEIYRRARHVVTENQRVVRAADALRANDARELGRLMDESHTSLRDDYEVSCRELDIMVELACGHDRCHGARLTGAGFGGCAVALFERRSAGPAADEVVASYRRATGLDARSYICQAARGAAVVEE